MPKVVTTALRTLPDLSKTGERPAERVAKGGSKLTYKQCLGYFPAVKECQYG